MNISSPFVTNLLYNSNLYLYLDLSSVKELSLSSLTLNKLLLPHIERDLIFCTPIFSIKSPKPTPFLKIYKKARRFASYIPKDHFYNTNTVWQVYPHSISHLFTTTMIKFPPSLTYLKLLGLNLDGEELPPFLTNLDLNGGITHNTLLPPTITHLKLGHYGESIKYPPNLSFLITPRRNDFPSTLAPPLTYLQFKDTEGYIRSTYDDVGNLPPSLTSLILSNNFNGPVVDKNLPPLTHITFGYKFNSAVDSLPPTVTHLKFGYYFDQSVDHLPPSLFSLRFDFRFNQNVNFLPKSLVHLFLGFYFNQPLENLPISLTHLTLTSHNFTQTFTNLPPLSYLKMDGYFLGFSDNVENLPKTTQKLMLSLGRCLETYPPSLTRIQFSQDFNQNVDYLPPTLLKLSFRSTFNQNIDNLPPFLTHLTLRGDFNQNLDNLPLSLISLSILNGHSEKGDRRGEFHKSIDYLPPHLVSLSIEGRFNKPVDYLPRSLRKFRIWSNFYQQLDNLPPDLKSLTLNVEFLAPLNYLPPSLSLLELGIPPESVSNFPPSLTNLILRISPTESIEGLPNLVKIGWGGGGHY